MTLNVELVSQEKSIFTENAVDMILIPATEGIIGVLPNHAPVLTTLSEGELIIRKQNAEESFLVFGGVVDIRPDKVVILADLAESTYDVDVEKANAARDRASRLLTEGVSSEDRIEAQRALRRAEITLRIKRKMQTRGQLLRILPAEIHEVDQ